MYLVVPFVVCIHCLFITKFNLCKQIEKHWMTNEVLEMTLEKLQMIATCNTSPLQKTKLLKKWNSSMPSPEARRFPPRPISEEKLLPFLNKSI